MKQPWRYMDIELPTLSLFMFQPTPGLYEGASFDFQDNPHAVTVEHARITKDGIRVILASDGFDLVDVDLVAVSAGKYESIPEMEYPEISLGVDDPDHVKPEDDSRTVAAVKDNRYVVKFWKLMLSNPLMAALTDTGRVVFAKALDEAQGTFRVHVDKKRYGVVQFEKDLESTTLMIKVTNDKNQEFEGSYNPQLVADAPRCANWVIERVLTGG